MAAKGQATELRSRPITSSIFIVSNSNYPQNRGARIVTANSS
jgi:hypothetical protein